MTLDDFSVRFKFVDWPNKGMPSVSTGVYLIWWGERFLYCGMSGREYEKKREEKLQKGQDYGLKDRLNSHQSGRLSGDQFCVYVANRLVIPSLTHDVLPKFGTGELTLDRCTKNFIDENNFEYQYIELSSSQSSRSLENKIRRGEFSIGKPFLNPKS